MTVDSRFAVKSKAIFEQKSFAQLHLLNWPPAMQEFHKAYVEFKEVSEEYKRDGQIDEQAGESEQIERFIGEVAERWKNTSTELRCVQSLLEEVLAYWKR